MPTLDKSNFNIVCAALGGFVTVFGLVSYLFKERLYLSEPLISLLAGVTFSPHATGLVQPLEYAGGSEKTLDDITHAFTRLVLGVQLVLAGVQLPSMYLWYQWKPLAYLLGPGMTGMWLLSSLLIWGLIQVSFLQALAIGACVTPTDPVLSNSIVKGRFADSNVPRELQRIIIAESGANDGLGYPFLFLALYLIKYPTDPRTAMGLWFSETWCYQILLGVAYGATVGWIAQELLHWAEEHRYVDRESFLVFAITLALFIVGTAGMIGSDDVLACFIAGNTFTMDDWFRLETLDDSLQPTIDMLLNLAVFMWFGAVAPWSSFAHGVVPVARLLPLGPLILLVRRLPVIVAMRTRIPQIEDWKETLFVGFFGPIGVSAIFYLFVSLDFLETVEEDGATSPAARHLQDVMRVVVWYLGMCSVVVHGLSVPLGKLGYHLPRTISTLSRASSIGVVSEPEREPARVSHDSASPAHHAHTAARPRHSDEEEAHHSPLPPPPPPPLVSLRNRLPLPKPLRQRQRQRQRQQEHPPPFILGSPVTPRSPARAEPVRQVFRLGGSIIRDQPRHAQEQEQGPAEHGELQEEERRGRSGEEKESQSQSQSQSEGRDGSANGEKAGEGGAVLEMAPGSPMSLDDSSSDRSAPVEREARARSSARGSEHDAGNEKLPAT